jgi:hypothetical protein
VKLALSALAELEAEIVGRLGEPGISQLRSTLLQILDRPAYTRRGIQRAVGMTTVRILDVTLTLTRVTLLLGLAWLS